jgi:hypothetical protein
MCPKNKVILLLSIQVRKFERLITSKILNYDKKAYPTDHFFDAVITFYFQSMQHDDC